MTAPLTPADCDLRDFAYMPLDAARMLDSDLYALSTGEEFKAAITLWCKSWTQVPAASLPDDDRVLAHLSGAGSRWKKVKDMALRGFIKCDDGRLYHPVVAEKALDAWGKKQSYRERSKKGNAKRWGSQKDGQEISFSDPSGIAKGILEPPKGEGEEEGSIPLDKSNGAKALPKPDPDKVFWDSAKAYLGKPKAALIGKWCSQYGQPETAKAITEAQIARAVDPVPYIERTLRGAKREAEFSGPC